jgi:uncharacterized protein DUF5667
MSAPTSADRGLAEALDRALADGVDDLRDRSEIADLVALARTLESTASEVRPRPAFKAAARRRLLAMTAASQASMDMRVRRTAGDVRKRVAVWIARLVAGFAALSFIGAAAASASASALPGDPLYPVKEATEAVAVRTAVNEEAREQVLLRQADTRLDETARLLEQGRTSDAATTATRFNDTVAAASSTAPAEEIQTRQARLENLLASAPAPARPGLERALETTQRALDRRGSPVPLEAPAEVAASPSPAALSAPEPAVDGADLSEPADRDDRRAAHNDKPVEHRLVVPAEGNPVADRHDPDEQPVTSDAEAPAHLAPPAGAARQAASDQSRDKSGGRNTPPSQQHNAPTRRGRP